MPRNANKQRKHPSNEAPVSLKEGFSLTFQSLGWAVLSVWSVLGWLPALVTLTIEWLRSLKDEK